MTHTTTMRRPPAPHTTVIGMDDRGCRHVYRYTNLYEVLPDIMTLRKMLREEMGDEIFRYRWFQLDRTTLTPSDPPASYMTLEEYSGGTR